MRQYIGIMNMVGLMENDASVEICKSADSHKPLGKVFAKSASTFPHFPQALLDLTFFRQQEQKPMNGTGNRNTGLRKGETSTGLCWYGIYRKR
jgi:hypothetical protein